MNALLTTDGSFRLDRVGGVPGRRIWPDNKGEATHFNKNSRLERTLSAGTFLSKLTRRYVMEVTEVDNKRASKTDVTI